MIAIRKQNLALNPDLKIKLCNESNNEREICILTSPA